MILTASRGEHLSDLFMMGEGLGVGVWVQIWLLSDF